MYFKTQINPLLDLEEGKRYTPYIDSEGYPTVGEGFKLGPKGAPLSHYTFTLDDATIDAWLTMDVNKTLGEMSDNDNISKAMAACNQPRKDILTSMAYQMGVTGLSGFHNMLACIQNNQWEEAAKEMLDSTWANQTPNRAQRHADVMRRGIWRPTYNFNKQ